MTRTTPTLDERLKKSILSMVDDHLDLTGMDAESRVVWDEDLFAGIAAIKQAVYAALVEQMPEKRDDGGDMQVTTMYGIENSAYNEGIDACLSVLSAVLGIGEEE